MIFATDVVSTAGHLLVARGQEVTPSLRERIQLLAENGAINKEITMIIPPPPPPPEPEPEPEAPAEEAGNEGDDTLHPPEAHAGDGSQSADDTLPILRASELPAET
ncbi:MAG: hypothetical protein R2834_22595 [Rhodothermales bacterium]